MKFNPIGAWHSLEFMVKGWGGVFIVIGIIYAMIVILNATTGKKTKEEQE